MENGPFEDVFPIENGDFQGYVSLPEGSSFIGAFTTKGVLQKLGFQLYRIHPSSLAGSQMHIWNDGLRPFGVVLVSFMFMFYPGDDKQTTLLEKE